MSAALPGRYVAWEGPVARRRPAEGSTSEHETARVVVVPADTDLPSDVPYVFVERGLPCRDSLTGQTQWAPADDEVSALALRCALQRVLSLPAMREAWA